MKNLMTGLLALFFLTFNSPCFAYFFVDQDYARQVGDNYASQIESSYGVSTNQQYQEKLNEIAGRLLQAKSSNPISLKVIRQDSLNAFSVPGGHIYVTSALMETLQRDGSDHELAFVLAHELGHENNEHFLKTTEKLMTSSLLISAAVRNNDNMRNRLMEVANISISRGYGFDKEHEADAYAFDSLTKADYNLGAGAAFFYRLEAASNGQGDSIQNFVHPHPKTSTRIQKQLNYISEYSGGIVKLDSTGTNVLINGLPAVLLQSGDPLGDKIRAAYIAGNLARAAKSGVIHKMKTDGNRIVCGNQHIMTLLPWDDDATTTTNRILKAYFH